MPFFPSASAFHPVVRLLTWVSLLLAAQRLGGAVLALACLLVPWLGRPVLRRSGRLVWRARWLLVSLFAVFAWGMAGEALWAGPLSPTREGLDEAWQHLGRMLLVLVCVAALLENLSLPELLSALHALMSPWRRFGLDATRGIVRLSLVLRYVDTLPRPRDWRVLLDAPDAPPGETVAIDHQALRRQDVLAIAALCLALGVVYARW